MHNIKIIVATHKECELPKDEIFFPIQVGKALSDKNLNMQGDDEGDNISRKNSSYCELTAIYWAWKNLKGLDYVGLCHYRRYFEFESHTFNEIILRTTKDIASIKVPKSRLNKLLKKYDIIVAKKRLYRYDLKADYCMCHFSDDYRILQDVIKEKSPEYNSTFESVMEHNNKLSLANMFISRWSIFTDYCNWLFPILAEVENRIDISKYSDLQKRIYGYMAERLFNVYIKHNKLQEKHLPVNFITDDFKLPSTFVKLFLDLKFSVSFFIGKKWFRKKTWK